MCCDGTNHNQPRGSGGLLNLSTPMLINHKKIIGLSVETQSGQRLGEIAGFAFDSETQTIYQYQVRSSGLSGIFAKELLVHRQQVISISEEKMLVDDLVYKELAAAKQAMKQQGVLAKSAVAATEV